MKTKFVVWSSKGYYGVVTAESDSRLEDSRFLAWLQQREPEHSWVRVARLLKGKHVCQSCGEIADGTNEELLCGTRKKVFGHSLVMEL